MNGPGCPSMAEYHELRRRRRRDDVELSPDPPREHLDLGGGAWLTVRAGLPPARRELLREAARELVAAVAANPDLLPSGFFPSNERKKPERPALNELDGGRRGD